MVDLTEQKGSRTVEVTAIMNEPRNPAAVPSGVIPPLVPGGTCRSVSDVIRRGCDFDRIPSSEENVSAVTAA